MILSPLLKHGITCKDECLDDVSLLSEDKDSLSESVGGSMDELEAKDVEASGSATAGTDRTSLVDSLSSTFPRPRVRFSIGLPIGIGITPESVPIGYKDITENPLMLLVSGIGGQAGCG